MADRYWVGGTGTWNASSTTNWSSTATGGGGASVPTSADHVFFGANSYSSGATITLSGAINCLRLSFLSSTACTVSGSSFTLNCFGSFNITSGSVNFTATGTINSTGSNSRVFEAACSISNVNVQFLSGGAVALLSNVSCLSISISIYTNFAGYSITASVVGTLSTTSANLASISLITPQVSISTTGIFNFDSGTIRTNILNISGTTNTFTYTDPAVLIGFDGVNPLTSITQTTGTVTLNKNLTLSSTSTYTLTAGTLTLGANLSTGIFTSAGTAVRGINFSTYNITLNHTTAAQTVLNVVNGTNFTWTGTGGFLTDASVTRTIAVGSTASGTLQGFNVTYTGSGSQTQSMTTSDFNNLDFGTTTCTVTGQITTARLILSAGGSYTGVTVRLIDSNNGATTNNITTNGKIIASFQNFAVLSTPTLTDSVSTGTYFQNAGNLNFAGFNLTCSSTVSYTAGTLSNIGTITCTTWTITGTFNFTTGTITPSVSFVLTSGAFNYNGGTLSPVPLFTHTAGTVTLSNSLALTSTGTYTFSGGQLNLGNYTLTTAIFNAGIALNSRSIDFGTSSLLEITGNNATVLNLNNLNSYTGTVQIICTYVGSVGTRTINIGGWSQSTVGTAAFDFKCNACVGIQVYGGATDIVVPGGNVLNFDLTGMNFTLTQGAMTIYGDYTIPASGGSVSANASTTTFASTNATARTITISRSIDFPITFNGVGGTFQLGANLTVTGATRIMSLLSGTLSLNGYNLTVGYFSSNNSNTRAISFGASNSITVNGTGTIWDTTITTGLTVTGSRTVNVATPGSSTISLVNGATEANAFDFNFSGTTTINFLMNAGLAARNVNFTGFTGTLNTTAAVTVFGSYTLSAGMTVVASSNIMTFGATSGTNIITTNGKTMPPMIINGIGGTFNLGSNLTSSGAIQVLAGTLDTTASNFNITCVSFDSATATNERAISLNGSTVTVSGTAGVTLNDVNLTFNCGTSQLTLSNATSTVLSVIGSETFRNVSFTGGAPLVTLVGINTYNNLTFTNGTSTAPSVVTITGNQTVGGTLSNSSTNALTRLQLQSSTSGSQIILSADAVSLTDVDFKDIYATGAAIPFTGTRLGDLGNNTNITFSAARTLYWNLVAGGNWNATAWATTSGGTPDINNFPLAQDTCIIENTGLNTSATITMNANWTFGTLNMATRTNAMTLAIGTTVPTVTGNWTNGTGTTLTGTGTVNFKNTGTTQTITASGITFTPNISYDSVGGTLQLTTALTLGATSTFTLTKGTLSLNGFTLTTGTFSSNNSFTRSIAFGTTNIILAHTTAGTNVLDMASLSNFSTSGTGQFTSAMSVTRTFNSGTLSAVTGSLAFNGTSQYALIPYGQGGTDWVGTLNVSSDAVPFTLEAWINLSSTPSGYGTIASLWERFANTNKAFAFSVNSSLQLTIQTGNAGGVATLSGGAIPLNTWTHVAWVKGSSLQYLYVNGQLVASNALNPNVGSPTVDFVIGARYQSPGYTSFFPGNISNVRFVNGVEVYTGNFTPSTSPLNPTQSSGTNISAITAGQTELLLNTQNNASILADGSINNFILSNAGATTSASTPITSLPAPGTPPSLSLTSGAAIPTLATGSYFTNLNFTGTTSVPAASLITVNGDLTLATGGTYTSLGVTMAGTGTITPLGKTIAAFAVNTPGTVTLAAALACTTFNMAAGTLNFATFNLTCSGGATFTSGTLSNQGTITCTTWTTQGTLAHSQGTITPSVSFTILSGSYTQSGTSSLGSVATFTQTAGNVTFRSTYALTATGTYTLTAGTLTLGGNLSTGIFSSSNANTRAINFSTFSIALTHTTAAQTVLNMAVATNFTWTGTGGFTTAMSVTRTLNFAASGGGTLSNAPNLSLTSGAAIPTITSGSWYNNLVFTGSTSVPVTATLNITGNLTLGGGTYAVLTINMLGLNGSINGAGRTLLGLNINTSGGTTSLTAALSLVATGTTTLTSGNLNLNGFTLTTGIFSSDNSNVRSINFTGTNIVLAHTTANQVVLNMATVTNFTYTTTGGGWASTMSVTRTFRFGSTAGGNITNAPSLALLSGSSIATITTGSWFDYVHFGTTAFTIAATNLNLNSLYSSSSTSVLTNLTATMKGTGSFTTNSSIGPLVIDNGASSGTTTLLTGTARCITCTINAGGSLNIASQTLICTSTFTHAGSSLTNIGTITCTAFNVTGVSFDFLSGTISPSTAFSVLSGGSFTYGPSAVLGAVATFTQTNGNVTLNKAYALTATGTYTLTTGTLTLGANLTTGVFSSHNQFFRSIAFNTFNIILAHTTATTTVLQMSDLSNFSSTGAGGFTTAMSVARTFSSGIVNGIPGSLTMTTGTSLLYTIDGTFAFGTNIDFTWEGWVYTSSTTGGGLFNNMNSVSDTGGIATYVVNGQAYWYRRDLNTTFGTTNPGSIPNNTWTHVAFQRRGVNFEIYINGSLASTYDGGGTITAGPSSQRFEIGKEGVSAGGNFIGNITNIRVVRGTAVYTGNFTTPTAPLTTAQLADTNISALSGLTTIIMMPAPQGTNFLYNAAQPLPGVGTNTGVVTNTSTPFGDNYTGQYAKLSITSGISISTFVSSSIFDVLDFTGLTGNSPTGSVSVNSLILNSAAASYLNLNVVCIGSGALTLFNRQIGTFQVKNGFVGGTVTLSAPLSVNINYTQTSGTIDFASNNLTINSGGTYTYVSGTQLNVSTITCASLLVQGAYNFSSGTVTPSTSVIVTSPGVFTYSDTATLSPVPTFTHTSGSVILNKAYALTATGTYTLTAGTLTLGANLTTGIFSSSNANTRAINFSTFNIILATTTAAQVNLAMAITTGFTFTGTGGFTAAANITRTFQFASTTAGGYEPNLTFTGSGTAIQTITTGSWFKTLDFGSTAFTLPTTSVNLNSLILSSGGTFTGLSATMFREGTITPNGKTIAALTINVTVSANPTTTLAGALACTTYTQTAGTIDFASFNLTCSSTGLFTAGTLSNIGTITCTTFTVAGVFAHTSGTITPSVSFVTTVGSYTQSGTSVLSPVATFTQTAGNVTFRDTQSLTTTGTYTLTAGTLTLGGNLSTGIFSSTGIGTRSIAFNTYNILLTHSTAAQTVLSMSDISNFSHTGTGGFESEMNVARTFNVSTSASGTKFGSAAFNGSSQFLNTASNAAFTFGTGDLTLECWIYQTATSTGAYKVIFADNVYGGTGGYTLYSYNNALNLWKGGSTQVQIIAPAGTITLNTWTHVSWTRSGSSNRLFIDGTQVGATTSDSTNYTGTSSYIGASVASTLFFPGYISNVRIVKGIGVYTGNFTPPKNILTVTQEVGLNIQSITGTETSLLLTTPNNADFLTDSSFNGISITNNGTISNSLTPVPVTEISSGVTNGSLSFSTNKYLSIGNNTAFNYGTGDFTIETWIYLNATGAPYTILSTFPSGFSGSTGTGYEFVITSLGFLYFETWTPGVNQISSASNYALTQINTWYHVSVVRSGGILNFYVNGVQCTKTANVTQAVNTNGTAAITIGYQLFSPYNHPLNGLISNLRVVKGVGVYTSDFDVPTSPLNKTQSSSFNISAITGTQTSLLLNTYIIGGVSPTYDGSTNNFVVTNVNSVTTSGLTPVPDLVRGSLFFPGVGGNHLIVPSNSAFTLGTGDFTIEYWIYATDVTGTKRIFGNVTASNDTGFSMDIDTNRIGMGGWATFTYFTPSPSLSAVFLNKWVHIAWVRINGVETLYVNGTVLGSVTRSLDFSGSGAVYLGIAGSLTGGSPMVGYLSNFRIVKGVGVYLGNFTVPSNPLTRKQAVVNGSASFNGSTQYLYVPGTNSQFAFGTGDFTVEMWIYQKARSATSALLYDSRPAGTGSTASHLAISVGPAGEFGAGAGTISLNTWYHIAVCRSGGILNFYVNGVQVYSGPNTTNWLNGTNRPIIGTDGNVPLSPGYIFNGYISNLRVVKGTAVYTGNFTVPSSPLSVTQSADVNGFPSAAVTGVQTSLLLNTYYDGYNPIVDRSTNRFTITNNDGTATSTLAPTFTNPTFVNGSISFNGSTQYLSTTKAGGWLSSDHTVEAWIYLNAYTSPAACIAGESNGISVDAWEWYVTASAIGIGYRLGATLTTISASTTFSLSTWYHVAFSRSGTTVRLFVNGVQVSSGTITNWTPQNILSIGYLESSFPYRFNGYISNFRLVNGVAVYTSNFTVPLDPLSAIQDADVNGFPSAAITGVQTSLLLNTYYDAFNLTDDSSTNNYTVTNNGGATTSELAPTFTKSQATNAFTGQATSLLLNTNSSGVSSILDSSINNFNITTVGSVAPSQLTPIPVLIPGSLLFAGGASNQRLSLPASSEFDLSGGTWTIEFWMNSTATPTAGNQCRIFMFGVNAQTTAFTVGYNNDGSITAARPSGGVTAMSSGAGIISTNVWYHVAVVSNAGSAKIFINGTQYGSTVAITQPTSSSPTLFIGYDTVATVNFQYQGYLSNIRIVKGLAVYTSNFTIPTNPLAATQFANGSGYPSSDIVTSQTSLLLNTYYGGTVSPTLDGSTNNFTVTNSGAISSAFAPITVASGVGVTSPSNLVPSLFLTSGSSIPTFVNNSWFKDLNFTGSSTIPAERTILISKDLTLSVGGTYTGLTVIAAGTGNYISTGKSISQFYINTSGGATLADAMDVSGTINLLSGTFNLSTYNATSNNFFSSGALSRGITGTGTYSVTGSGSTAFFNINAALISITGITISLTSASAKTFAGGGGSYSTLNQGGAGALTISGNNSFTDITATTTPSTISFTAGSTQTVTGFTLSGTLGNLVTINSTTPGTQFNLSRASGTVSVGYLNIEDSNATGGASWYADVTSFNVGNNTGWIFTAPPGGVYLGNFFAFF